MPFPGHVWSLSNFPFICGCFRMSYSLMSGAEDGKSEKSVGVKKGTGPLNPLAVPSAGRGGACNKGEGQQQWFPTCLSAPVIRSSNHPSAAEPWYLEDEALFAHLGSCKRHGGCSRNRAQLPAPWVAGVAVSCCLLWTLQLEQTPQGRRPRGCASYF